jgi:hypothetical protein
MATPQEEANHAITAASTDEQLNAKARRCAYVQGINAWVLYQIFALQRDVARLKAGQRPPHLQDAEQR